jgi:hypothetical protein
LHVYDLPRTLTASPGDESQHALLLCRGDDRADVDLRDGRVAVAQLRNARRERVEQLVVHAQGRDHAARREAVLTGVPEPATAIARATALGSESSRTITGALLQISR